MTNIEKLQEEEINNLTQEEETYTLESLITEGAELKIPITFNFPTKNGMKKVSAIIKPVTASEWDSAQMYAMKNKKEFMVKILEKGLLDDNEKPLPINLIRLLPFGVATEIYNQIADLSGVKQNRQEQYQLTKDLLGF